MSPLFIIGGVEDAGEFPARCAKNAAMPVPGPQGVGNCLEVFLLSNRNCCSNPTSGSVLVYAWMTSDQIKHQESEIKTTSAELCRTKPIGRGPESAERLGADGWICETKPIRWTGALILRIGNCSRMPTVMSTGRLRNKANWGSQNRRKVLCGKGVMFVRKIMRNKANWQETVEARADRMGGCAKQSQFEVSQVAGAIRAIASKLASRDSLFRNQVGSGD